MERLKRELPKQGWEIVEHGKSGSWACTRGRGTTPPEPRWPPTSTGWRRSGTPARRSRAMRSSTTRSSAASRTARAGGDVCVELGSGIGAYTPLLARRWRRVVATEVSHEMLRLAPRDVGHRVLADGARLPMVPASADAVMLVNCFLFPDEVARVLAPGGVVVWVNSSGSETPIHLPPEDVVEALPGRWEGVREHRGDRDLERSVAARPLIGPGSDSLPPPTVDSP